MREESIGGVIREGCEFFFIVNGSDSTWPELGNECRIEGVEIVAGEATGSPCGAGYLAEPNSEFTEGLWMGHLWMV